MIKLNLGRSCLKVIIRTYGIKEIFIPYYSCKTIWQAIREEDCKIRFYHIDKDFMPDCEFSKDSYILYINYFGLFAKNCKILSKKYKNLITDNTQAFYAPIFGLATFNSLRKFFPVQNGAYLQIKKEPRMNFETDNLKLNTGILCMQGDEIFRRHSEALAEESSKQTTHNDKYYINYEQFRQNELILNNEPIKLISGEVEKQMDDIDFESDKKRRIELFNLYAKEFNHYNLIKLPPLEDNIPYCYPLCTNNKDIAEKLSGKTILRLWDDIPKSFPEYEFLYNVASLLCR